MYVPIKIELENFQSHPNSTYTFREGSTTMIYGENLDDPGADSNGSGKSAFVRGIAVGLLDVYDTSLNKDDFIKDNEAGCRIYLEFFNDLDKTNLQIERFIYRKKSTKLKIVVNDQEVMSITSVKEGNEFILDKIGISKEDLLNYFLIDQSNSHSFFLATDTQQKKIISRFVNLDILDNCGEESKIIKKSKEKEKQDLETDIQIGYSEIENLRESIEYEMNRATEERVDDNFDEELDKIDQRINSFRSKLKSLLISMKETEQQIQSKENPKDKLKQYRLKSVEIQKKSRAKESEIDEFDQIIRELNKQMTDSVTCPKCHHEFSVSDPDFDLDFAKEKIKECNDAIKILSEQLRQTKASLDKILEKAEQAEDLVIEYEELLESKKELEDNEKSIRRKIKLQEENKIDIEKAKKEKREIKIDKKRINDLESKIKNIEQSITESQEEIRKIDEEIVEYGLIERLFIRDFKNFLINKTLNTLEGYVNLNLSKFNTNLKVKINGFVQNKSGDISDKIDILVSRDDENWQKFKRHSGGQKQRINVCGILTLRDLINQNSPSGGLNLLVLDEIFEGLDPRGQKEVLNILDNSEATCLVISHNNADIGWKEQVWVRYQDGESYLT